MNIDEKWQKDKTQKFISDAIYGGDFVPINASDYISMQDKIPPYDGFGDIPYYNYCYGSAFGYWSHIGLCTYTTDDAGNDILHVGMSTDTAGGFVKHYLSARTPTSGGIDARIFLTDLAVHQNADNVWQNNRSPGYYVAANNFNPFLDLTYERVKLGVRFKVVDTLIPWGQSGYLIDVDDIDTLLSMDKDRYLVWYTETYNWIKNDNGGWYRGTNRQSSFDICHINEHFIVQQNGIKRGTSYVYEGVNIVPQCMFDFLKQGNNALLRGDEMPLRSADTGYNAIGLYHSDNSENLDLLCVVGSKQKLASGVTYYCCNDYGANSHRYVFRSLFDIEQTIKELAFLGLIICPINDPDTYQHDYVGYINNNGEATGKLLKYEDFKKSDSLQNTYKSMVETPDIPVKPPAIHNDDLDDMQYFSQSIPSFLKSYVLDESLLDRLIEFLDNSDISLFEKIVSLQFYPFKINGGEYKYIKIGNEYTEIQAQIAHKTQKIYLGRFYVETKYNDFRDYAPYTKWTLHTMWTPNINIDVNACIGSYCYVYLAIDPQNASGFIIVTYKSGGIEIPISITPCKTGVQIPVSVNGSELQQQAITRNVLTFAGDLISSGGQIVSGIATKNVGAVVSGALPLINDTFDTIKTLNTDYTQSSGSQGITADLMQPLTPFVTVKRQKSIIPNNYPHEYGYKCNVSNNVSHFTGFTVFTNVDTSGLSCTEQEKEQIKNLLETGVIL